MQQDHISAPFSRAVLRVIPAALLQKMINGLLLGMRHDRPRLFKNLERLQASVIRVEPSDLTHKFELTFGQGPASLTIVGDEERPHNACIKGKLESLLDMLEGRVDGDMLFFARDIEITGDTSIVVALRNTIDREEINLLDDATGVFGPFAKPVRRIAVLADKAAQRVRARISEIAAERRETAPDTKIKAECDGLRAEVQALKTRLAKLEVNRQRTEAAAQ